MHVSVPGTPTEFQHICMMLMLENSIVEAGINQLDADTVPVRR